jgi:YggT family protein
LPADINADARSTCRGKNSRLIAPQTENFMRAFRDVIMLVLQLYWYVVLAMIIMSWLISFNVVNTRNEFVNQVWRALNALTEPVLRPIRRVLPNFSGLDLSPLVLFLIIIFIQQVIIRYIYPNVF